jgi:hypothetical protein
MSVRLYRLLLRLYPAHIRQRWEEEMVETFSLQLADHGREAWTDAALDLLRVALPRQAARAALVVPCVSLVGSCAVFYGLFWALANSIRLLALYHHVIAKFGG